MVAVVTRHFGINPYVLQISFGFLSRDGVVLLDEAEMAQYVQLGGGDVPKPSLP
jgi:hypothetical protein